MAGDELVFQPRGGENFVDPNAQGTFLTVFFRADDVRKNWTGKGLTIEVVYEFENCDVIASNLPPRILGIGGKYSSGAFFLSAAIHAEIRVWWI